MEFGHPADEGQGDTSLPEPAVAVAAAEAPAAFQHADIASEQAAPEPSLFDDMDAEASVPEPSEWPQTAALAADDGLPEPAYQPAPEPEMPVYATSAQHDEPAETFIAPRPAASGTPSPEAMARLQAATARAQGVNAAPATSGTGREPRFGLNSLINRMTGHNSPTPEPAAPRPHTEPPVASAHGARGHAAGEPQGEHDQDRIEIPAFLRRQAN